MGAGGYKRTPLHSGQFKDKRGIVNCRVSGLPSSLEASSNASGMAYKSICRRLRRGGRGDQACLCRVALWHVRARDGDMHRTNGE